MREKVGFIEDELKFWSCWREMLSKRRDQRDDHVMAWVWGQEGGGR